MNELSQRITTLSQEQLADFLQRLASKKRQEAAEEPIGPRAHDAGPAPLSFSQERLWFLDQLEPGTPNYNMAAAVTLRGTLRPALLHRAIHQVIRRHEALRTTFAAVEGAPVQVVAAVLHLDLPMLDLGDLPAPERRSELDRLVRESTLRPFDLGLGPLLHTWLVRLGARDHVLLFCIHHIVTDGWSMTLFMREVAAFYEAGVTDRPADLLKLTIQYPDFAVWQHGWLRGPTLERLVSYWRKHLDGVPVLELPSDRPRPAVQSRRGGNHLFEVPPDLTVALQRYSQMEGGTLFMVLLAAFKTVLLRWCGQDDVAVGTFIANRNRRQIEELIGFFVNNLPLRTQFAPELTFRELLARVQDTTVEAYAHQDLPFEKLLEELQPRRSTSHTPIFQVMLVLQNTPKMRLELPGVTLERVNLGSEHSNFDLTLWIEEEEGLAVRLEHATDLFDFSTVTRLARQFIRILRSVVADPGQRLCELPLLDDEERRQLLAWATLAGDVPPEGLVHSLFEAQVSARPDAVALVVGGQPETYRELAEQVHRLARALHRLGVRPEMAVGVCVDPTAEVVVPLLAILEVGGAFLPLDPAYPPDRLKFMLEDAGARLVLTQEKVAARLPESIRRVPVDAGAAGPAGEGDGAPQNTAGPENLAYLIYTSGTTGRPKGVPVTHRNLLPMLLWGRRCFGLDERSRVLQNLSYGFDFGVFEILTTLSSGGSLHFPGGMRGDFAHQARYIAEHGINTVHTTPSFFREILAAGAPVGDLRVIHLGGEALSRSLVEQIWAAAGEKGAVRVLNGYGPTEATVNSTIFEVAGPEAAWGRSAVLPIGRPTAANAVYLLDPWRSLVPVGAPGELCVGGPGVVRGYLARPELTAGKFVPDPFGAVPGGRLYRTGDLARWLPTGSIEFLGRIDQQVKIRGYRIELEEIEAVLRACPGVREAVVAVRTDGIGGQRLAAYLVTVEGEDVHAGAVRAFAEPLLPAYMVPATMVFLPALPLTASGKVDRRALPEPELSWPELDQVYVAPRTPTEEVIAGIWAEVLGVARVGVHDGFFELGGHSLLATQIVGRVREAIGVELPLHAFFESPSVAKLAEVIEEERHPEVPPVRPVPRGVTLPLSFAQERLWFLERLHPGQTAYYVPRAVRIRGRLEIPCLERAYSGLVTRHEVLRTTFPEVGGRPVQVIHAPWPFRLPLVDLRGLPGETREHETRRLLGDEGKRRFDLSRDPLIRATALWTGESEHLLLQTEHHLVHDGWAQGVLLRDLLELYSASDAGRRPELPPLHVQYADFAAWQREWLSGSVLEKQVAFWVRQLADAPPLLELPTDRPRPSVLRSHGGEHLFDLSHALADKLRAFARRQGVTLFMAMLAVFQVLLHRLSGQTDLVLGSGVANRRRAETEGMIGMMVNTLVLRTDLAGSPTLRELLLRVRRVCLQAYAHQDLPFDKLVEALRPERSMSYSPIFQTNFGFNDAPTPEWEVDGLRVEEVPTHNHSSKFDLLVIASPHAEQRTAFATRARGSGINLALEYNLDLFDSPTTLRFLHQYQTLLEDACAAPDRSIGELQWLLPAEIHQTLVEWNDAVTSYPREASLAELFVSVARDRPDAPAVIDQDGSVWIYHRLDEASNRLANRLRALGAGPEVAVGIAMERSPELIVGMLAIVKTGSPYVPLDPSYPDERLAFMLADAGVEIVLVDETTRGRLEGKARLLSMAEGGPAGPLDVRAPAEALALVIYTSGSTGQPKGVALPQRGVVRLVRETNFLRIGPGNRLGLASNISFDAATLEIWGALLNGAALVVLPLEAVLSPADLASRLERHEVDTLHLTTALFNQMARERPEALARLRTVMFGGEAADPFAVGRALRASGASRLIHFYGPTESTTFATWHRVREVAPGAVTVPIGLPVANSQIYVLDRLQQPVPRGVVGELFVGGDGLARGYLNRPDMTAGSFIPHPWGCGSRLYRTGDLVRQLPDGVLEFVGRRDGQVKIRGFRIEPGEIEAALASHPEVAEAVVAVREETPGGRRLVAYVVPWAGAALDAGGLRQHLRRGLPEHMIPAAFVVLAALPLTPNGKVDRRALPAPEAEVPAEPSAAPRTLVEEVLAGLWAELLGLSRVGAHDRFFELGGHSLLVTQLASRLRGAFGVELPLRTLFERPTVAELAAAVEEARRGGETTVPALAPVERQGELPLSFAQERLWFLDQLEPGSVAYSIPVAFRLSGPFDGQALAAALGEIVRRHEVLRTTFAAGNGRPVQRVATPEPMAVPLVDLGGLPEEERTAESGRVAAAEAARPFDLARGPLLRLTLVRLAAAEHQALLNMHHIVSDGWSVGVLVRELTALYPAFLSGEGSPLPELPLQYADFALWQRRWLQGEILDSHLGYWRERLTNAPALLELRTDHPRPEVQSFRGAARRAVLPPPLAERLKKLSVREGCTLFMTLLTAFQVLLHVESGERDILVGSPISYRNWPEIEGLIGFFVNTLVYRLEVAANPTFRELLGQTRERALEAFTYQHLPFDRLVEELRPERSLAYNPVSQVGFTFQSLGGEPFALPGGLTLEPIEFDSGTTQFDLNLTFVDAPEGLLEALRYSRDLYEDVTISWLQENLHTLLEQVADDPEVRLDELKRRLAALGENRWAAAGKELAQTSLPVPRGPVRKRVTVDAPGAR